MVFDPTIDNLYTYKNKNKIESSNFTEITNSVFAAYFQAVENNLMEISLWVYKSKSRQYFNEDFAKKDLIKNLKCVSEFQRKKVATSYHHWVYETLGCKTKYEYLEARQEMEDALKEIEQDTDDWLGRLKIINSEEM